MRAVLQRVLSTAVTVDHRPISKIGIGWLVLLGVGKDDTETDAWFMIDKIVQLRAFADSEGKMNQSVLDVGGEILVVSQFTLYGDTRKGRRPSFTDAAPPELAKALYERVMEGLSGSGVRVAGGEFRSHMMVSLVNDGPVTFWLDSHL